MRVIFRVKYKAMANIFFPDGNLHPNDNPILQGHGMGPFGNLANWMDNPMLPQWPPAAEHLQVAFNNIAGHRVAHHRLLGRKSSAKYKETAFGPSRWNEVTVMRPSTNPPTLKRGNIAKPWQGPGGGIQITDIGYRPYSYVDAMDTRKTQKQKGGRGGVKKKDAKKVAQQKAERQRQKSPPV